MRRSPPFTVVALAAIGLSGGLRGAQAPADTFELVCRPVRGGGPEVTAIEIRAEWRCSTSRQGQPFSIQAPITYASVTGIADRIEGLEVKDAGGIVPLTVADDPLNPGGFPYYRH